MLLHRPAHARGQVRTGWLDSRHSFSFGHYHDPAWMGFGPLRVINEDRVSGGGGFAPHGHANMEILSWVLDGGLQHRDSTGGGGVIRPGDLQAMSAGHGVEHSEFNASATEPVHFLQIWIQPDRVNAPPRYQQAHFPVEGREGRLQLLASPDGAEGSIAIRQSARVYAARPQAGAPLALPLAPGRRAWVQVARGAVIANGLALGEGDGLALADEVALDLRADGDAPAEVLVFDLP
jgi:hypothetical protein